MAKFDQKQQNVGHQVNIGSVEGPVTIYTTPTPTADSYFQRGLELLRICNYPEASKAIEAAIAISPSPNYFYYHALALLRWRRACPARTRRRSAGRRCAGTR